MEQNSTFVDRSTRALGGARHVLRKDPWHHNTQAIALLEAIALSIAGLLALSQHMPPWAYVPLAGAGFGLAYSAVIMVVLRQASQRAMFLSHRTGRRRWL